MPKVVKRSVSLPSEVFAALEREAQAQGQTGGTVVALRTCLDCSMAVKLKCWKRLRRNERVSFGKSAKTRLDLFMQWWLRLPFDEKPLSSRLIEAISNRSPELLTER